MNIQPSATGLTVLLGRNKSLAYFHYVPRAGNGLTFWIGAFFGDAAALAPRLPSPKKQFNLNKRNTIYYKAENLMIGVKGRW